ncbi:MAG: hypothetical protein PHR43_00090 [Dehalococcoidales bacterium]|nr:hypothetical protein [Dehalococcoidales bacterium]
MNMDGRAASLKAREYLVELNGSYNIWNFQVENVEYNEQNKTWAVQCSFTPNMFVTERLKYEIIVSDTGSIKSAKKVK